MELLLFCVELLVGHLAVFLDDGDFLGVIRPVVGSHEVVLPACEIPVGGGGAVGDHLPDALPGLVGLVEARDEAPAVAADMLQEVERDEFLHIAVADAVQPFGVDDGATQLLQLVKHFDIDVIIAI